MSGTDSASSPPVQERVPNRDRQPPARKTTPRAIFPPSAQMQASEEQQTASDPSIGRGRGWWFEWELADQKLQDEIDNITVGQLPTYTHTQTVPAATWVITHNMGLMPNVVLLDDSGQQMIAEIQYPSDQTVVIVHSTPYTGTAYLRP